MKFGQMDSHMIPLRLIFVGIIGGVFVLAGCNAPRQNAGAAIALTRLPDGKVPESAAGRCWASDTTPAIIETVTEQILLHRERRNADGAVIAAAQFQTKTAQHLVQDREIVWFRAPCPPDFTVVFVASLQRALKARGRFYGAVTGVYDAGTGEAVRKLQSERGLDSPVMALDTARELGLAASDLR